MRTGALILLVLACTKPAGPSFYCNDLGRCVLSEQGAFTRPVPRASCSRSATAITVACYVREDDCAANMLPQAWPCKWYHSDDPELLAR